MGYFTINGCYVDEFNKKELIKQIHNHSSKFIIEHEFSDENDYHLDFLDETHLIIKGKLINNFNDIDDANKNCYFLIDNLKIKKFININKKRLIKYIKNNYDNIKNFDRKTSNVSINSSTNGFVIRFNKICGCLDNLYDNEKGYSEVIIIKGKIIMPKIKVVLK